jgi:hypothetical protein
MTAALGLIAVDIVDFTADQLVIVASSSERLRPLGSLLLYLSDMA